MDMLRTRVARKVGKFVKQAQAPMPPAPTPAPAPIPGAPAAPGAAPPKPPMAGPAAPRPPVPGAPPTGLPGQKPKEEIEQDVEKDIRRRKEQEKKLDELSENVTGISDQMDGLTKGLNTLVNLLQKQMGDTTDFEKKFDEVKEDEDEERSSTEFGLSKGDESLVRAKEGHVMSNPATLRDARKQRLNAEELDYEYGTPENKKYKQVVPAPQITKLKEEPKDWDKYYNKLKASDLAMDLNAAGTEWAVVNKHTDQVFFKLHPNAATADKFATKEFAEAVIKDVKEMGVAAAMQKHSAEPFSSDLFKRDEGGKPAGKSGKPPFGSDLLKPKTDMGKKPFPLKKKPEIKKDMPPLGKKDPPPMDKADKDVDIGLGDKDLDLKKAADNETAAEVIEPAVETPAVEPAVEPVTEVKEASVTDYKRRFVRAFRLALSAQQKNLADNPLKASWYETLVEFNVPDPEKVIEATFARAAAEHFEVALAKTAEYLGMGDESFVELEAQIGELGTMPPVVTASAELDRNEELKIRANALRARAHRASLPITSATAVQEHAERLSDVLPKPQLHGIPAFKR